MSPVWLISFMSFQAASPEVMSTGDAKSDEIVVIGERLKRWKAKVRSRDGRLECDVRQSTNDATIDAIGCDAMIGCMMSSQADFLKANSRDLSRSERRAAKSAVNASFTECVLERRANLIDQLAERRVRELGS